VFVEYVSAFYFLDLLILQLFRGFARRFFLSELQLSFAVGHQMLRAGRVVINRFQEISECFLCRRALYLEYD
jgi:hypothetical protein